MPSHIKQKYPKALAEVIWTLRIERLSHSEIMRRIRENEAGLGRAYDLPRATYFDKLRKLRHARGDERDAVRPGDEVDTVEAIDRRILALANAEIRELEAKRRRKEPLSNADLTRLDRAASISARLRRPRPQAANPRKPERGARAKNDGPLVSLDMLGSKVETASEDLAIHAKHAGVRATANARAAFDDRRKWMADGTQSAARETDP